MSIGMRIVTLLAALVAVSGLAAAQSPCPECDDDGEPNPDNDYHSLDVGIVENETEALADSDAAYHFREDGFFAWLNICLSTFVAKVGEVLGVDADADATVDVYASESGADIDAKAWLAGETLVDFDETEAGDLDGMTWDVMGEANTQLDEAGAPRSYPQQPEDIANTDNDVCVTGELELATC